MDRLALARQALAAAEERTGLRSMVTQGFELPTYLHGALPHGVPRRGVVSSDSHFLVIALAALVSPQAWVAFLGRNDTGWHCALNLGLDPQKIAYVPDTGLDSARVISAAMAGFEVLVLGNMGLSPGQRRILQQQALAKDRLIIASHWPNPTLKLSCKLSRIHGLDSASGSIRAIDYQISSSWGKSLVRYSSAGLSQQPPLLEAL